VVYTVGAKLNYGWKTLLAATAIHAALSLADPFRSYAMWQPHGVRSALYRLIADEANPQEPDAIIFALMSGKCTTFKIAGQSFNCRAVAFFQTEDGRANYTVAIDDPVDDSHTITFSGDNGRREGELYELPIDRMQLKSKYRPKADGLPVPLIEPSGGICKQNGSFITRQMSTISCSATSSNGSKFELEYQSDGLPMEIKRIKRTRIGPVPVSPFDEK
jgi:hypothetical protein